MVTMRVANYLRHVDCLHSSVSYFKLMTFVVTDRSLKIAGPHEAVAKLAGAGLAETGLVGTRLAGAELAGAGLAGAGLVGTGIVWDRTGWDGSGQVWSGRGGSGHAKPNTLRTCDIKHADKKTMSKVR